METPKAECPYCHSEDVEELVTDKHGTTIYGCRCCSKLFNISRPK